MGTRCFMLEQSGLVSRSLRRYSNSDGCQAPGPYHQALTPLDQAPGLTDGDGYHVQSMPTPPKGHPGWPTACPCGYAFADDDPWQLFEQALYRRLDTGELVTLRGAPPGAVWHADWMVRGLDFSDPGGPPWHWWPGPDGLCLHVRLPDGHDWCIDSRAKNCTMPADNFHRCWVRHGAPPDLTVDKSGGPTCAAGAGSIQSPGGWHGFLRGGELVS